ncbi:MAG TPA: hypothetical protein VFX21_16610 [Acidimicrobiia bacterium]|nr:hypothetical protein [Acidimicrobiia bacterium]
MDRISRRALALAGVVTILLSFCSFFAIAASASGNPNPDCPADTIEFSTGSNPIQGLAVGGQKQYVSDGETFTFTKVDDVTLNWSSTIPVSLVYMKGGPTAQLYTYDPPATSGSGLTPAINPNNNQPYGISHVVMCIPDTWSSTTTSTTLASTTTTSTTVAPTTTSTTLEPTTTSTTVAPTTTSTTMEPTTTTSTTVEPTTTSTTAEPTTTTSTTIAVLGSTSTTVEPTTTTVAASGSTSTTLVAAGDTGVTTTTVAPSAPASGASTPALPFTGSNLVLAAFGVLALAAGGACLVAASRRRV